MMRVRTAVALVAVVGILALTGCISLSAIAPSHAAAPPAPAAVAYHSLSPAAGLVAPGSGRTAAEPRPSNACATPNNPPLWNVANFFHDVQVSFSVPGSPALGPSFQILPCANSLPTYTSGFWLNLSTNVPITTALVTIWGFTWPTPSNAQPFLPGFSPANISQIPMKLNPPSYKTASFFFNDYRFFWPGSQIYFNVTVQSTNATPSTIYSARAPYSNAVKFPGGIDNATWGFGVAAPWSGANVFNPSTNLSKYIQVTTIPTVLGSPAFDPNPFQPLQVILTSYNLTGGAATPIPAAQLAMNLSGAQTGSFNLPLGPANHTVMMLPTGIGPYPGTNVSFTVSAWLPWQTGIVDRIYSPTFHFNWSTNGGWWGPSLGLEQNLQLSTRPNLLGLPGPASLATGTPVNISVHQPIQNVTIGSAEVHFHYWDISGTTVGHLRMSAANSNTSFIVLPGLPSGGHLTFSVVVKDVYGTPLSSGNLSYDESGPLGAPPPAGYGAFFFEAVDLATGNLVPSLNYTVTNGSWTQSTTATALGFGYPTPLAGGGYLAVAFGTYVVTIRAFGQTDSATVVVSPNTPLTPIVFYVTSAPVPSNTWVPTNTVPLAAIIGLIGIAVVTVPILSWFKERRAKAEKEQKRISL